MPGTGPSAEETVTRMRAIAAELSAAGLDTRLHQSPACIDVTATARLEGLREMEAIIDDDGYAELHFWTQPGTTPAQVSAIITRAIAAVQRW